MRRLILALLVCLIPPALHAQSASPTPAVPAQAKATSPVQSAEFAEAERLNASVLQLYAAGKYKEALPLAERVLALREKASGDEDAFVGSALNNLATLYLTLKHSDKALPILERILARQEKLKTASSRMTMTLIMSYICLTSAKGTSLRVRGVKPSERRVTLTDRINAILLQDAILAAGLAVPENLSELSADIITRKPQPRYSAEAKSARLQGSVVVLAEADETGKVLSAEPVECWIGQKPLADAAAEALREARFKQVSINGKPIKLKAIAMYNFVLR
ncbi:MAG TPA: tetratricopeptide repeat protein [Pyrinomonadaceae bacterium]|jgi:tetratricopeptide (TPR) repeat protein